MKQKVNCLMHIQIHRVAYNHNQGCREGQHRGGRELTSITCVGFESRPQNMTGKHPDHCTHHTFGLHSGNLYQKQYLYAWKVLQHTVNVFEICSQQYCIITS